MVAQCFALILHELATNAANYGAFSGPQGQVEIKGTIERTEKKKSLRFSGSKSEGHKSRPPRERVLAHPS
jgi:two-component sensor histidine kinase